LIIPASCPRSPHTHRDRIKGEVEELTEQVVDATRPFSETLKGGSLQEQRVPSAEMALYLGLQKGAVFSQLCVLP